MKSEIINLSTEDSSFFLSYSDLQKKLTSEIFKIKNKYIGNIELDTMKLGHRLLNYISDCRSFSKVNNMNISDEALVNGVEVGVYCGFHVYLDHNIKSDYIYLTVNRNELRDIKINNIIDDEINIEDYIIEIEIILW